MSIYVSFAKPKTMKEFIEQFFSNGPSWNGSYSVATYHDKECTKIQCAPNRNRSIQDIYECVKTYFPRASLTKIVEELVLLRPGGRVFTPYRCCTIGRPVAQWTERSYASYHYVPRIGKAEFSWGRILKEELGIKTMKDMVDYKPKRRKANARKTIHQSVHPN